MACVYVFSFGVASSQLVLSVLNGLRLSDFLGQLTCSLGLFSTFTLNILESKLFLCFFFNLFLSEQHYTFLIYFEITPLVVLFFFLIG